MDQPDYTPDPGTQEEGTYPEPDYIPAYPWLGQQDQGGSRLRSNSPLRDVDSTLDEGFGPQKQDREVERLGSAIDYEMERSLFQGSPLRQHDDPAVDPDFELSDGSRMCVS